MYVLLIGLGTLLKDNIQQFPYASTTWQAQNSNLSSVFNAMKHYAYKPLSRLVFYVDSLSGLTILDCTFGIL
jgi:uncharacterized protein (UPF0297 family)